MLCSGRTPWLQYWVAERPLPGQSASGDQHLVCVLDGGVLVAVIDGIGHGPAAHLAATTATRVLSQHAHEPLPRLLQHCHEALRKTRGAVITLASFRASDNTMTWVGIGNVDAILVRAHRPGEVPHRPVAIIPRGGIVGDRLPRFIPAMLPIGEGDLLFLATDGICSSFVRDVHEDLPPDQLVEQLFLRHARDTDDALLLGAQWINGHSTSVQPA